MSIYIFKCLTVNPIQSTLHVMQHSHQDILLLKTGCELINFDDFYCFLRLFHLYNIGNMFFGNVVCFFYQSKQTFWSKTAKY